MPKFAIKRWDGEVHVVEAASLEDAGNRYGWPGNGTIEPYEAASHAADTTANFASVDEHDAFVNSSEYQDAQLAKVTKLDKEAQKAKADAEKADAAKADSKGDK